MFHSQAFAHQLFCDELLGERFEGGSALTEARTIQRLIDEAMANLQRDKKTPTGQTPRDAHAKSHGLLKIHFTVDNKKLPPNLRVGIFKNDGKEYDGWLRFSNNHSDPVRHDAELDLRGAAIKLLGVEGRKILPGEEDATTADFLMFGSPRFFVKDIGRYGPFIRALGKGESVKHLLLHEPASFFKLTPAVLKIRNETNPLAIEYFSATPYRLGHPDDPERRAIKFKIQRVLCDQQKEFRVIPADRTDPNYMRHALIEGMKDDACFEFQVQLQRGGEQMPIEDSSVLWPDRFNWLQPWRLSSPYFSVATIRIPAQTFDTAERWQMAENFSFTPWHTLPEHQPLGRTNRARRFLYDAISKYRHEMNKVPRIEP